MPVPPFNLDGVIPPYIGSAGPGDHSDLMSPYQTTCVEVVRSLGTTPHRLTILERWLNHRAALRGIGIGAGFQWLDGSFLEDKIPNDLDLVTFLDLPHAIIQQGNAFFPPHQHLFERGAVKLAFSLDAFWVNLRARPQSIVMLSRYYFGLFAHRRGDDLWKGMLEVNLADATEAAAVALVAAGLVPTAAAAAGAP